MDRETLKGGYKLGIGVIEKNIFEVVIIAGVW